MKYYTLLKQDGTQELLHKGNDKNYDWIRDQVGDPLIELIPKAHYPAGMDGLVWGGESAALNLFNTRNPHMLVTNWRKQEYDVIGDVLLEQSEKQYQAWKGGKE